MLNKISSFYNKFQIYIESTFVFITAFVYFNYQQSLSKFLLGTDAYYHIKFSYLTRTSGIIKSFPWAQFSLWKDHFFDKEFLFHILLIPFTFGNLLFGAKLATALFGAAVFLTFYIVLKKSSIKFPLLFTGFLFTSGGFFLYRICVTRPQIFSIILALLLIYFIFKRNYWVTFFLTFAYSLTYTGHYIVFVYVFFFMLIDYLENKKLDWKILMFPLAGVVLGWILHPNFPNNIFGFYIQNIQVLVSAWASNVNLHLGGELFPMDTRQLVLINTTSMIFIFIAFFLKLAFNPKSSKLSKYLFLITCFYFLAGMMARRFAEYWVPLTIWFSASAITDYLDTIDIKELYKKYKIEFIQVIILILISMAILFVRSNIDLINQTSGARHLPYQNTAIWMAKNIPSGENVYTTDWDEAPYLFYINHKNNYMIFLDPNFMYHHNSNAWKNWDDLSNGRKKSEEVYPLLKDYFNCRWIFVDNAFFNFHQQLTKNPKIKLRYNGGDSSIFELVD